VAVEIEKRDKAKGNKRRKEERKKNNTLRETFH
jgi:hypothetical protein